MRRKIQKSRIICAKIVNASSLAAMHWIYKGCHSSVVKRILLMTIQGFGVRDISVIEGISIVKVLSALIKSSYAIKPKCHQYASLEVDEFWTYV
jgi:hypothetical protein